MTSLSTHTDLYKFTERVDIEVNTLSEKLQLTASLNGKNLTVPNLPLWINRNVDAKFDRPEQLSLSFGYTRKIPSKFVPIPCYGLNNVKFSTPYRYVLTGGINCKYFR